MVVGFWKLEDDVLVCNFVCILICVPFFLNYWYIITCVQHFVLFISNKIFTHPHSIDMVLAMSKTETTWPVSSFAVLSVQNIVCGSYWWHSTLYDDDMGCVIGRIHYGLKVVFCFRHFTASIIIIMQNCSHALNTCKCLKSIFLLEPC